MKDMPQYYHPKIIPMITHYLEPLLPGTKHKETTKLVITSNNAPGRRKIPRNMINYTRNKLRINLVFCRTYTGRLLRFNVVLKTSPAPAMKLIFNEVHKKLHCRLGPQQYVNGINLAGFCATGLFEFVQEQIDTCMACMEAKMVLKGMCTIIQNMK